MSELRIYSEQGPAPGAAPLTVTREGAEIAERLAAIGVRFERWSAGRDLPAGAGTDEVLSAYAESVARLKSQHGFTSVDVVSLHPEHPERAAFRNKFLDEHTHAEDEVRFFVEGRGLFYLRSGGEVFGVLCEAGDLLSVPAGTTHWFDMGPRPCFRCIRLFTNPQGWVAKFTGSDVARRFPYLDEVA